MHKKKIAAVTMAMIISNFSASTISVLAHELDTNKIVQTISSQEENQENQEEQENQVSEAEVNKFDLLNSKHLEEYNKSFKLDNSKITSISNNGGNYGSSSISKAIDGNLSTHWETGKSNSSSFENEVILKLDEVTSLSRIVYAARQDGAKGKGFAQEFEIYASLSDKEDDFNLVSYGKYTGSTGDVVEIKFNSTQFKRIKFVFKKANQDWASASEFMLYHEDNLIDKMYDIFTNDKKNEISEDFNTLEKLDKFESEAINHPLYEDVKEDIDNARTLLESNSLEYVDASISKFLSINDNRLASYDEEFKIKRENITSITANGGHYSNNTIDKAIDGNPGTNWHSGKTNSSLFTNEIVITLDKLTTIDRITYYNKVSRGFAEAFEIYASKTTTGDTFEKISAGSYSVSTDNLEIKFKATELRRIKFVFKKGYENWAQVYELGLYKEDAVKEAMDRLFIDSNMTEVSAEFSTVSAIESLIKEVKGHPLEEEYQEKLSIAKDLVEFGTIVAGSANVKKFDAFYSEYIDKYDEEYRISNDKISISNNGGNYGSSLLKYAIDDDANTHWETGKANSNSFKNEVILTLDEAESISRLTYKARNEIKGFAENFSIYISPVSSGDNFQKVTQGNYTATSDMIEITFDKTKAKRVKFVFEKANQDWASISDIRLYKQDIESEKIARLFTSIAMDTVSEEFNSIEKLNALEEEVKNHPLYNLFKEDIDDARDIVEGKIQNIKTVVAEQHGNRNAHNTTNLKFGYGNNNQPTGVYALAGETITVYVDAEEGQPLPQLVFSQHEGSYARWGRTVSLHPGKNVITVPAVNQVGGGFVYNVTAGGPIYILNPYTEEEQGKAPIIRFAEGVEAFPMVDANTNDEELIEFIKEFKKKVDEDVANNPDVMDRKVIDVFELVSDHMVLTVTATGAYDAFVTKGKTPTESVTMWNDHMNMLFEYQGIDGRSETHDIKYTRENIRLAQPFGYMYAASGHIGVQRDVMSALLTSVGGWGVDHEMGHKMDISVRTIGEVTNNMLPQYSSYYYNSPNKRIPFESHVYKNVMATDSNSYHAGGFFEKLAVFWQLEMVYPGYWAKLNSLYRENNVVLDSNNATNDKLNKLAYYSSIALEIDLSEHFERHGFWVSDETKEFVSKYNKPDKKIWYANYDYIEYEGEGFTNEPTINISTSLEGNNTKLSFDVDSESKEHVMGYEIYKNGQLVAFTSTNSYVDTDTNLEENSTYKVVAFDKRLNEGGEVEINTYTPSIQIQQSTINLKLNEEFNPMDLIKAYNYKGEDITSQVVINSNLDVTKKGNYQVEYLITDQGITTKEILNVTVASDYDYLSDSEWSSVTTQHGTPRRNTNITGRVNGAIKTFDKGFGIHANGKITYNLEGNEYQDFEALLGVDMSINENSNSSITFKIVGDGVTLATTNVRTYSDDMLHINVPVEGVKELVIEVYDGGNGNTLDHAVIANAKLTTNNAKPTINAKDKSLKIGEELNLMENITATDAEDGDLTSQIEIESSNFKENKVGRYEVVYKVTDSDNNVTTKNINVVVSEDYTVKKSLYGSFTNLEEYNNQFKLRVASVSNNAGHYGSSSISKAIDGKLNTHWETNKTNSSSFSNEVIFDLGEVQEISKIAYAARQDGAKGKGFAQKFEIYASDDASGDNFYLVGEGSYTNAITDVVEFNTDNISARRIIFKFVEANQGWASLSEVSFYKQDVLSGKIENDLFTNASKTNVSENYNTLEKLDALREEVKNHPAFNLFEDDLNKAEEIIRSSFPTLNIPKSQSTKLGEVIDINGEYNATDKEDGDITSSVEVTGKVNFNKPGKYPIIYTVTDSDGNKVSETRNIAVVNMDDYTYLTEYNWTSTKNSYRSPNTDKAISGNALRLTDENNKEVIYERGIGAHSTSTIIYDLTDKDYSYFTSYIGVDRAMFGTIASVSFEVYVDGEKKFDSGLMNSRDTQKLVEVDIADAKELKLVVTDGGNGNGSDHATWGDTKLHFANNE